MKKEYMYGKRTLIMTTLLIIMTGLMSLTTSAQETLVWNGSVDTDASNPVNWTPNGTVFGNILTVDSVQKVPNFPILTLSGDNSPISMINVAATGMFTIADAGNFLDINNGNSTYLNGTLVLQNGAVSYRKSLYLENPASVVNIEGGSMEFRSYLLMGDRNGTGGGKVNISGDGLVYCRVVPGRFANDTLQSVITITENGILETAGDWVADAQYYIGRNQITSDDNFDPFAVYDVDRGRTVIDLRSKDELFLINPGTIQVLEGETVPAVHAVQNRGFENLVTKEWKYATSSGGTYQSFDPVQSGDSLYNATFALFGTYFVVLTGNDGSTDLTSDEVVVSVTSDMVSIDPAGEQTVRVGWTGGMITATTKETATSFEWKYASNTGGPYASFSPAVQVSEYIPDFATEGNFYVVCEAVVNGNTYYSPEALIKMVPRNAPKQSIAWTGAYGTDASDNRNYEPMMHPWFNTVSVSRDFIANPPVLATTGNDTIAYIMLADSAEFIVNKASTDTLTFTADEYQFGKIIVNGGVINNRQYGRLDGNNSGFILNNDAELIAGGTGGFIIGQKDGPNGGIITLNDNSRMWVPSANIFRWATDTTHSILTVADNATLEMPGDLTGTVATWAITYNQLRAPEGFELQWVYDATNDITIVSAKSEVAFDITPLDAQYVGIGMDFDELSTINAEVITSQEWKYSTTSGTGYVSFDPAETGATLIASFDAAGTYYVVCEGSDGVDTYTSDEAIINVVSVEISPATTQEIFEFAEGELLTVTESVAPDSREWKSTTTSGSGYTSFSPARLSDTYRPFFAAEGTYFVVCESVYGGKGIVSNEVEVIVSKEVGIQSKESLDLRVYPNPSEGTFYLDVETGSSFIVEVFDITGKLVFDRTYINVNGPQEITISTEGLHLMKVTQNDKVRTEKVVVK